MGHRDNVGKYRFSRTILEGNFTKVKLAIDNAKGQPDAIKIIEKNKIMGNNHMGCQIQRDIKTIKLLHHPNIVRNTRLVMNLEVLGTKSKLYIVKEYVSGGLLSGKLAYSKKLCEREARKLFQQLIYAVNNCHARGAITEI